jgi:predicted flavoprotein YhiN
LIRKFDALVLGGGAAGLLCAIEAGKRGRRVAMLEHADRIGKKILISGGGAVISPTFIANRKILFPRMNTSLNPRWHGTRPRISLR